jgi:hypothetical protein
MAAIKAKKAAEDEGDDWDVSTLASGGISKKGHKTGKGRKLWRKLLCF